HATKGVTRRQVASARTSTLILKKDNTFINQDEGVTREGTWAFKDGLLTLSPTMMEGLPIEEVKAAILKRAQGKPDEQEAKDYVRQLSDAWALRLSLDKKRLVSMDSGQSDSSFYFEKISR